MHSRGLISDSLHLDGTPSSLVRHAHWRVQRRRRQVNGIVLSSWSSNELGEGAWSVNQASIACLLGCLSTCLFVPLATEEAERTDR